MVGCNYRFDAGMILMKQFLDDNQIGHLYSLRATFGLYLLNWCPNTDYRNNYASKRDTGSGVIRLRMLHILSKLLFGLERVR